MMQMSHQQHHLHTGQVPTASQQPHHHQTAATHLHGQQLQMNAQQQHTMSHQMQHQVMMSQQQPQQQQQQQQQQSHMTMTPQHYGLSASHTANVAHQSMESLPMAQQPHYMNQQSNHSQLQQHQRQQQHQFLQHQQQYRQGQLQQVQVAGANDKEAVQIKPPAKHEPVDSNPMLCVRRGCTNLAIISDEWEDEYCSNECAVSHCREVFNSFHKVDPEPNYSQQTFNRATE